MRALVTGATGFVGGAIARRLLAEGFDVHACVRVPERAAALEAAGARVFSATLADPEAIARAAAGCEVAFHAAGSSSHRAEPAVLGWINVAGTENVLRAARHAGVERLVHISCCDVTLSGAPRNNWDEDKAPVGFPADPHARSKLEAEELIIGLGGVGIETVALRPALLWGPGDHTNLPGLCREGLEGGIRLVGRGDNLVATTYIDNLAEAALLSATAPVAAGGIYIVCDEELTLQGELFAALAEAVGLPPPRRGPALPFALAAARVRQRRGTAGPWPTDVRRRGCRTSFNGGKAARDLGYQGKVRRAEGLAALRAWALEVGGPAAIAALARPAPTSEDIEAQVQSASR